MRRYRIFKILEVGKMESSFGAAEGVLRKRYSLGGRSYKMSRMEKGDNRILELF